MGFFFPGDVEVGGDLNLATGSNIVLPSGSDIVLGEGANIQGQGDIDGNFSGSFTGSFSGSFIGDGSQIVNLNIMDTVGNLSGSRIVGDIQASSVDYDNVLNKPTLVSGSQQIIDLGFIQTTGSDPNSVLSASVAEFAKTASLALAVDFDVITGLPNNLVSSSTQIEELGFITASVSGGVDYDDIANKPTLVSGSQQIIDLGFVQTTGSDPNLVQSASHAEFAITSSHALNVPFNAITSLPDNLVSSSTQIENFGFITASVSGGVNYDDIANKPTLISSSTQIEDFGFITASISGGVDYSDIANKPTLVSSSQQIIDLGFVQTTGSDPNLVASSSFAFTASVAKSVDFDVITGLPDNLISSSTQIEDFGFITASVSGGVDYTDIANKPTLVSSSAQISALGFVQTTGSDPNLVASSSFAFTASVAKSVDFDVITGLPDNLISSSTQISNLGFVTSTGSDPNLVASSSFAFTASVANAVNFEVITGLPDGLLSSSDQVQALGFVQTTGSDPNLVASSSFAFTASVAKSVDFDVITGLPDDLVSSSAQITLADTTGNISGSRVVGDIQASSVDFDNVLNKPVLFSQSIQVDINSVFGDLFYGTVDTAGSNWVSGSSQISFTGISNKPALISGSGQVDVNSTTGNINFNRVSNKPALVSSSAQVDVNSTIGNINYNRVSNKPALVSGSTQVINLLDGQDITLGIVTATELNTNIVSSSVLFTSGSNIIGDEITDKHEFTGSVFITGSLQVTGTTLISSSQQITDLGFIQTTGSDPNLVQSASHAEFAKTASIANSVNFEVITGLPDNLVSSSTQIEGFGFITASVSGGVDYGDIANKPTLVSSSAQINIGNTTGSLNANRLTGTITADSVDVVSSNLDSYQNLVYVDGTGNSKALKADSGLTYNSSLDILRVSDLEGTATSASYVDFSNVKNKPSLVSGSSQITLADTTGNISGSRVIGDIAASSVDYANVNNKPTLVSSSAQINLGSATGTASNAVSASFADNALSSSAAITASYIDPTTLDLSVLNSYTNDTDAAAGGVPIGGMYRNGNYLQVRIT